MDINRLILNKKKHMEEHCDFNVLDNNFISLNSLVDWVKIRAKNNLTLGTKFRILELGTKRSNPNHPTNKKFMFSDINNIEYIMTDYQNGLDVDIVCDIHKINNTFETESFDLIISCSTFEHFKYPQLCSHNLMKILKINGIIFIQTHHSFPLHGYKYDYFRFSREALKSIFSNKMNFKTISTYFTDDCVIIPHDIPTAWNYIAEAYLNVVYVGEKYDKTPEEYIYDIESEN